MFDEIKIKKLYEIVEDVYKDVFKNDNIDVYDGYDGLEEEDLLCIDVMCDEKIIDWQKGNLFFKIFIREQDVTTVIALNGVCEDINKVNKLVDIYNQTKFKDTWEFDCDEVCCLLSQFEYEDIYELAIKLKKSLKVLLEDECINAMSPIIDCYEEFETLMNKEKVDKNDIKFNWNDGRNVIVFNSSKKMPNRVLEVINGGGLRFIINGVPIEYKLSQITGVYGELPKFFNEGCIVLNGKNKFDDTVLCENINGKKEYIIVYFTKSQINDYNFVKEMIKEINNKNNINIRLLMK